MEDEHRIVLKYFPLGSCTTCFKKRKAWFTTFLDEHLHQSINCIELQIFEDIEHDQFESQKAKEFFHWLKADLYRRHRKDVKISVSDTKGNRDIFFSVIRKGLTCVLAFLFLVGTLVFSGCYTQNSPEAGVSTVNQNFDSAMAKFDSEYKVMLSEIDSLSRAGNVEIDLLQQKNKELGEKLKIFLDSLKHIDIKDLDTVWLSQELIKYNYSSDTVYLGNDTIIINRNTQNNPPNTNTNHVTGIPMWFILTSAILFVLIWIFVIIGKIKRTAKKELIDS